MQWVFSDGHTRGFGLRIEPRFVDVLVLGRVPRRPRAAGVAMPEIPMLSSDDTVGGTLLGEWAVLCKWATM